MDRFKKTAFKNCYKELCSQAEDFLDDLLERGSPSSAPCSGRREVQANESLLRLCEAPRRRRARVSPGSWHPPTGPPTAL